MTSRSSEKKSRKAEAGSNKGGSIAHSMLLDAEILAPWCPIVAPRHLERDFFFTFLT